MIRAEAPKSHYDSGTHRHFITFGEAVPACARGCWALLRQKNIARPSQETLSAVFQTDTKQIKRPRENQMGTCAAEGLQTGIVLILLERNFRYIL